MNDRAPLSVTSKQQPQHKEAKLPAAARTQTQDAYARLYGQLLAPLGLNADSFQLMMPGVAWNWEADNGFIDPALGCQAMVSASNAPLLPVVTNSGEVSVQSRVSIVHRNFLFASNNRLHSTLVAHA
jgi:hypothetical protein